MAKQNFISGGYYGKLGDTVGQRWKNKRTIRSYVIPKNPQTELQQANRQRFRNIVPFAQLGMSANSGTNAFSSEEITIWQYRMKTASAYNSAGYEELDIVPLYPMGYTVPFVISAIKRTTVAKDDFQYFKIEGTLPEETRQCLLIAKYVDGSETPSQVYLFKATIETTENYNLKVSLPSNLEITTDTKVRIISTDDTDSAIDMIASAMLQVQKADITYLDFDTTITAISNDGATYSIKTAQSYLDGVNTIGTVTLKSVIRGEWQTNNLTDVTIENEDGYAVIKGTLENYDENNAPALPTGSEVYISSIEMSSDLYIISATDKTESVESEDLTRSASVTFKADSETTLAVGVTFTFGSTGTASTLLSSLSTTLVYNGTSLTVESATVATSVEDNGAGTINIKSTATNTDYHCIQGCSVTIPNFSIVANGVTYNITGATISDYKNNAEKIVLTFDTTVSSVTHSSSTYKITLAQKWIDGTATLSSASIKSVIRGEWQTKALSSIAVSNSGGYVQISGILADYSSSNVPALPTGSSVTLGAISLESDVYKITAGASTNAYNNSDLTRSASVTFTADSTTNNAFRVTFSFGGSNTMTVVTTGYTCALKSNRLGAMTTYDTLSATVGGLTSSTREITTTATAMSNICKYKCLLNVGAFTIKVLGVTYNISAVSDISVTNNAGYGIIQGSMFSSDTETGSTTETESVDAYFTLKLQLDSSTSQNLYQLSGATQSDAIDCVPITAEGEYLSDFSLEFVNPYTGSGSPEVNFCGSYTDLSEGLVYPIEIQEVDFKNNYLVWSVGGKTIKYKCTQIDTLYVESQ